MVDKCYNPVEQAMHNQLGYSCDGKLHHNAPEIPTLEDDKNKKYDTILAIVLVAGIVLILLLALLDGFSTLSGYSERGV